MHKNIVHSYWNVLDDDCDTVYNHSLQKFFLSFVLRIYQTLSEI